MYLAPYPPLAVHKRGHMEFSLLWCLRPGGLDRAARHRMRVPVHCQFVQCRANSSTEICALRHPLLVTMVQQSIGIRVPWRQRLVGSSSLNRRAFRELVDMLPEEQKNSKRVKELAGWSCTTTMHLVEINAQPIEGENNSRDFDFSRAAVQTRWRAGYVDACRTLERRPWDDPIDPATQVTLYQSDAPA